MQLIYNVTAYDTTQVIKLAWSCIGFLGIQHNAIKFDPVTKSVTLMLHAGQQ
jgi:hypothetical protein